MSCCPPLAANAQGLALVSTAAVAVPTSADLTNMVRLPGGRFRMGCDRQEGEPADGEGPSRLVQLSPFMMSRTAVSNREFASFVAATGHVSLAEEIGASFVFAGLLPIDFAPTRGVADAPWWREVSGACWRQPEGPGSTVLGRQDHPVLHMSWHDAMAYCAWTGTCLPTEAQWEYAARGGLPAQRYPWGDDLVPGGEHRCNIWQGRFPRHNKLEDGFYGTAPVSAYAPNGYGLHNLCGNAWEWCSDWFGAEPDPSPPADPVGPAEGRRRVIRGGSFLCHESYCFRYRVAARSSNDPMATTGHMGFRCAAPAATP